MKISKFFLVFFIVFSICSRVVADDSIEPVEEILPINSENISVLPQTYSRYIAVYERNSKTFLYEKNSLEKCKMASTTKIMTSILILENCDLNSFTTVSQNSANTGGSRLGLHTGDVISVKDLLYGLLLCSGNDAAVALAETCSETVENFSILMNKKAEELGLTSTHFVTPHGLDNDNHYTTAYDFAILTDFALNNPQFLQIVGTKYYTVTINNSSKSIHNTNELLGVLPSVYGVKTGYTSQAGRCLITAAKQDNLDIIIVVFGADTKKIRTDDSIKLLNYIFSNYEAIDLSALIKEKYLDFQKYILPYMIIDKSTSQLSSKLEDIKYTYYPIRKEMLNSISLCISEENLSAPILENQKIAEINLFVDNNLLFSTNILSSAYIKKKGAIDYLLYFVENYKNFYQLN